MIEEKLDELSESIQREFMMVRNEIKEQIDALSMDMKKVTAFKIRTATEQLKCPHCKKTLTPSDF